MADDNTELNLNQETVGKVLTPAARRALDEAAARRLAQASLVVSPENDGPRGVEPTRFGDWERKGIAYDF